MSDKQPNWTSSDVPPGAWTPAHRLAKRALAPVERFLNIEAASGIVLLCIAGIALAWANSPWASSYLSVWHTPIGLKLGAFQVERDLHFIINDGLMTIFFFVVGLEIRREIRAGELSEIRRAALPLFAALGGMLLPALIFAAFNHGRESAQGWGIPMATDIAFAVGVLALLGKRVPPALRILLLALAVIDDVGAILVIALFYSSELSSSGLAIIAFGVLGIALMQMVGVRYAWAYVIPAVVVWTGAYVTGVHPTLAGVAVGLMTPVRAWLKRETFFARALAVIYDVQQREVDEREGEPLQAEGLRHLQREVVSPVERIQHALHKWVAFGVMPLFALANAGVPVAGISISGTTLFLFIGIILGLVVGKLAGIWGLAWLATRLGFAALPRGVAWRQVTVVGAAGGIGFTMALFIAQLAFQPGALLEAAKLSILIGSGIAAALTFIFGRLALPVQAKLDGAQTNFEAESSTEN